MKYQVRELRQREYKLLENFLYEAIFIPEGVEPPPKTIIKAPELQVYISGFGRKGDYALVAETGGKPAGAVWCRIMDDYGHIDDETSSLAIALFKEYRGHGMGTALLRRMLLRLKKEGYRRVSLSVQKANYAVKLYREAGFSAVHETEEEWIMVCQLSGAVSEDDGYFCPDKKIW